MSDLDDTAVADDNAGMQDSIFGDSDMTDVFGGADGTDAQAQNDGGDGGAAAPDGQADGNAEPQGFEQQFFTDGAFDAEAANNFLSTLGSGYGPVTDMYGQAQAQAPAAPQKTDAQAEWEKQFQAEQAERESLAKPYMSFREAMVKAYNEGFRGNQCAARAEQIVQEDINKEWSRRQYQKNFERQEKERKEREEADRRRELVPKSKTVLGQMYAKFKNGEKDFNSLIFGQRVKGQDGKEMFNGYGVQAINVLYELMNANVTVPPEKMQGHFNDWWTSVSANPNALGLIYDIAVAKLQQAMAKHTAAALKAKGKAEGAATGAASGKAKPSPTQRKQPIDSDKRGKSRLDRFLDDDGVDTL